jgi:hypothetical protein
MHLAAARSSSFLQRADSILQSRQEAEAAAVEFRSNEQRRRIKRAPLLAPCCPGLPRIWPNQILGLKNLNENKGDV